MARPKGSRNKKYAIPEQLEKDAVTEEALEVAQEHVEEKIKNFSPAHDIERDKILLATHTVHPDSRYEDEEPEDDRASLPSYLRNLPEGSDKSKTIIAAAQAALILGTPAAQVAKQYGIRYARVTEWQDTLITVGAVGRRDRLSDMLMAFIEQEMKSLMAISMVTSDEDWIMRQNAAELAHFIAVKADRLLLLLQAFGRVDSTRQQYAQQLQVVENA